MKKILMMLVFVCAVCLFVTGLGASVATAVKGDKKTTYYPLSEAQMIIPKGAEGSFDSVRTHTLSIVELNRDGYRFWGYYQGYDGKNIRHDMGLVRSNDLVHWEKYSSEPIIRNLRWGAAVVEDGEINMIGTRNYGENPYLVRLTSQDGVHFTERETVVPPTEGAKTQNPFVFYDDKAGVYRFYYYYRLGKTYEIRERHAERMEQLAMAPDNLLMADSQRLIAAPSMLLRNGRYWLTVETLEKVRGKDTWKTLAFVSDDPLKGFVPADNTELLVDSDACFFPYVFDNTLYGVYSHEYADGSWEMYLRTHSFELGVRLKVGKTQRLLKQNSVDTLSIHALFPNGADKIVTGRAVYATSDPSVITVHQGRVTASGKGTAIVTVSFGGVSQKITYQVQ